MLTFRDPDGMVIDLVASDGDHRSGWDGVADIPAEHAVRGLHAITLSERELDPSAGMLTDLLGMSLTGRGRRPCPFRRWRAAAPARWSTCSAGVQDRGLQAGGTVHHVAFRAPDLADHDRLAAGARRAGVSVTQILDRQYFKSIYFREPGGVLFEIATDAPGFAVDEPLLELGRNLKLPPWLEPSREQIAAVTAAAAARRRHPVTLVLRGLDRPHVFLPADESAAADRRCCCCTAPAATSTTCCRCATTSRPGAAVLSVRGSVLENGMPRFFRRLREGVFDEDDLRRRADELADFVHGRRCRVRDRGALAGRGRLLQRRQHRLRAAAAASGLPRRGAVLLSAMIPFAEPPAADLTGAVIVISNGDRDPMIPADMTERLAAQLRERRRGGGRAAARRRPPDRRPAAAPDRLDHRPSGATRSLTNG